MTQQSSHWARSAPTIRVGVLGLLAALLLVLPLALASRAEAFIYWAGIDSIGRANLDGTGVDQNFILTVDPRDIAVDGEHIYWTTASGIGRAKLDGTDVEPSFIPSVGDAPLRSVAVDAGHLYWSYYSCPGGNQRCTGAIARANLDGTGVDSSFIEVPCGATVAVDSLTDTKLAGKASAVRTQRQTGKKIVVKVNVKARERLTAKASGEIKVNPTYKVRPNEVQVAAGETKTLRLKPKKAKAKKIARALKRGEKAKARVEVKLTDLAGNRETEKLRVRLKR